MKKIIILSILTSFFLSSPLHMRNADAADVTSLVFSQTSSAKTSTPNLRVTVMKRVLRKDDNIIPIQGFALQENATFNYYLTKNQTFTVTADYIAVQLGVDQDTKLYVNSETAYKVIPAGETRTYVLQ